MMGDARVSAVGIPISGSGLIRDKAIFAGLSKPFFFFLGGLSDIAYQYACSPRASTVPLDLRGMSGANVAVQGHVRLRELPGWSPRLEGEPPRKAWRYLWRGQWRQDWRGGLDHVQLTASRRQQRFADFHICNGSEGGWMGSREQKSGKDQGNAYLAKGVLVMEVADPQGSGVKRQRSPPSSSTRKPPKCPGLGLSRVC